MKTERNIMIAFILNLCFSLFEFIGGSISGSVAIMSDAVHDMGDAVSIGISWILEKTSKKQPDEKYTYGYIRYSLMGGIISSVVLLNASLFVICNAVKRLINPIPINYEGMIIFAVTGVAVNTVAAFFTRHGNSINQKSVNLHMLEDVLGWIVVLVGAVVIKYTNFLFIDPVMSLATAGFIFVNAARNLKEIIDIFLEKTPPDINVKEIIKQIKELDGIKDVHHFHIRSIDGHKNYATMHIVTNEEGCEIKRIIRQKLNETGIDHITLELEKENEHCHEKICNTSFENCVGHHH